MCGTTHVQVAAFLLDHGGFAGVPPTMAAMVHMPVSTSTSSSSSSSSAATNAYAAAEAVANAERGAIDGDGNGDNDNSDDSTAHSRLISPYDDDDDEGDSLNAATAAATALRIGGGDGGDGTLGRKIGSLAASSTSSSLDLDDALATAAADRHLLTKGHGEDGVGGGNTNLNNNINNNDGMSSQPPLTELKLGSLQKFSANIASAEEMGPTRFSAAAVHKIGILDLRLVNLDRHLGNILVSGGDGGDSEFDLTPIDHSYCLPDFRQVSDVR
jgi:hypothetical protein